MARFLWTRLLFASVLLIFAWPGWSPALSASVLTDLHMSAWEVSPREDACILQQVIPRHGVVRFLAVPSQSLRFQIRPSIPLTEPAMGVLWLTPPPWRNDLVGRPLGAVALRAGPTLVTVGEAKALEIYHGLRQGFALTLRDAGAVEGSAAVAADGRSPNHWVILPTHIYELQVDFRECNGWSPPLDFEALDEWQFRFEFNSTDIDRRSTLELRRIAYWLRNNPGTRLIVAGHADTQGDSRYNQTLSVRRAEAVRRVLEAEGLPRERVQILGFGDTQPLRLPEREEAWQFNRRVDVWWVDGVR